MCCVVRDKWNLCVVKIWVCYRVFVRDQSEFRCADRIKCMRILCEYFVTSARVLIIRICDICDTFVRARVMLRCDSLCIDIYCEICVKLVQNVPNKILSERHGINRGCRTAGCD